MPKVCRAPECEIELTHPLAVYCSERCNGIVRRLNPAYVEKHKEWNNRWKRESRAHANFVTRNCDHIIRAQESCLVTEKDWRRLQARYRHRCFYCRKPHTAMQMDHIIPVSRGGRHSIGNLMPACPPCNASKSDKLYTEWRVYLADKAWYAANERS